MTAIPAARIPPHGTYARKRWKLWEAQHRTCHWCKRPIRFRDATTDHLIPKCRGGSNAAANLVASCRPCNIERAAKGHSLDFEPANQWGRRYGGKSCRDRLRQLRHINPNDSIR